MTCIKSFLLICLVLCAILPSIYSQTSIQPNSKVVAFLKTYRTTYIMAMLENRPDLVQPYYSDSVRMMPAFQKTIFGKNNATIYYKAFANRFNIQALTIGNLELIDLGKQVLQIDTFNMIIKNRIVGKTYAINGTYFNIWEKSSPGSLLLITEGWNYSGYYSDLHDQLRFEDVPAIYAAFLPNVKVKNGISLELAALNRLLDETLTQHDAEVWSQYYASEGMLIPSYQAPCKGKAEIDAYIKMHVKELPIFESLDIRNDHIDDLGTYVIEYASHIASWKNSGSSGVSMGKNIRIWRRELDHSLKLFRSISMYD